jgi:transposase
MYIRRTTNSYKGKPYTNYLLVVSVATPKGPRQRTVCSLGNLKPRPRKEWLLLAHKVERALSGQQDLPLEAPDPLVGEIAAKARRAKTGGADSNTEEAVPVILDKISFEHQREAGTIHVADQMWRRLGMDDILEAAGLPEKARLLTQVMVANRLVSPSSEHAMPGWAGRTAVADILGDLPGINDDALYRQMDRLHPLREEIERELGVRERNLFDLDDTIYLYDLTSTYFEGQCEGNPEAQLGYSRDHREDCKQVVVGLMVNRDGFPKAHEIFDGSTVDCETVEGMLAVLFARTGWREGATVVVDRGMSGAGNLASIKACKLHYVVAARQEERNEWLGELECEDGWEEVIRTPSPTNLYQKKSSIKVLRRERDGEVFILCISEERIAKDRAIRESHEKKLLLDLEKAAESVRAGRLKEAGKIHERIGRLKERYPRVARYYGISYTPGDGLVWREDKAKKETAAKLDGSYILKTDRFDLSADEVWRIYSLLTRAEMAFKAMKSPLAERPIFHQLRDRVHTHIFLCILAYHLLVSIEKTLHDKGCYLSWQSVREILSTHQVATIVLPTANGDVIRIRKGATPEPQHKEIYGLLGIGSEIMKPIKTRTPKDL